MCRCIHFLIRCEIIGTNFAKNNEKREKKRRRVKMCQALLAADQQGIYCVSYPGYIDRF